MAEIATPAPVTLTERAATHVLRLMQKSGSAGLRIGVEKGGCAGMAYAMEHVSQVDPGDVVIEQAGARVMIAPQAQMFLAGTRIDYEDGLLESGFRFANPNVVDSCGCGDSIKFEPAASKAG